MPLTPWSSSAFHNDDVARLYRALLAHRELAGQYYHRILTPVTLGSPYSGIRGAPIGALLRLWGGWPGFGGSCPECDGRMLGVGGGGLLSTAILSGVCSGCALVATRRLSGIAEVMHGVRTALEGTGHSLIRVRGMVRDYRPLIAILRELGADGIPAQEAEGLAPIG